MHTKKSSSAQWKELRAMLEAQHSGASARVAKGTLPHPRAAGARPTATFPVGQVADYSLEAPSGPPLVVREFSEQYEAALDGVRMAANLVDAVNAQPNGAMYLGAALLGGAMGSSLSQKREGVMIGAGLGLLFAALLEANIVPDRGKR